MFIEYHSIFFMSIVRKKHIVSNKDSYFKMYIAANNLH
jgi:hypothetical protein